MIFNPKIVWNLLFICIDLEQTYAFGFDWHIAEIIMFCILIFSGYQAFVGSTITNQHLFPLVFLTFCFCKSSSLRVLAATIIIKMGLVLSYNT